MGKNMKGNLNEPYGENYENDLTLQEVYQFSNEKFKKSMECQFMIIFMKCLKIQRSIQHQIPEQIRF